MKKDFSFKVFFMASVKFQRNTELSMKKIITSGPGLSYEGFHRFIGYVCTNVAGLSFEKPIEAERMPLIVSAVRYLNKDSFA